MKANQLQPSKPITIAGGGLAGLSLGIGLSRHGVPVILHEADHYPRHRVCGEFISGVQAETLEQLGISDCLEDATPATTTAWFRGERCFYRRRLPESARGISRYRLDLRLAERLIALGGDLRTGSRFRHAENSDSSGLIAATGRRPRRGSEWLGLKMHLRGFDLQADLEMHLGDDGYVGLSRVEDDTVNACGLFRRRTAGGVRGSEAPLIRQLRECGLGELAERMRQSPSVQGSCLGVSAFELGFQHPPLTNAPPATDGSTDCGPLFLGDRFAIIGPFTGNGMSMAFESAALALPRILDYSRGEISWSECLQLSHDSMEEAFRRRIGLSNRLHPWLTASAGQSALVALGRSRLLPFEGLFRRLR